MLIDILAQHVAAHHHAGDLRLRDLRAVLLDDGTVAYFFAIAQHRVAVTELHDLAQLVGDEDDRRALRLGQVAHDCKHVVDLFLRQRCGRFIHDDEPRAAQKGLCDLHDLLVRSIEIPHHRARVDGNVHALEDLARLLAHPGDVQAPEAIAQLVAQEHVFVDRQIVDDIQFLVDEGDAFALGVQRRMNVHHSVKEADAAAVHGRDATQYVHQCGLSGAVFSQQRMDLAALHRKIHVFEYRYAAVLFYNAAHLQRKFGHSNYLALRCALSSGRGALQLCRAPPAIQRLICRTSATVGGEPPAHSPVKCAS